MDPFGVLVLGVVTAVGGGTIRDMALANGPVFWVKDPTDLVVAMVTSMLTILLVRQPRRLPKWILPVLDAVGLAVFVGIGVNKPFSPAVVRWWRSAWGWSPASAAGLSVTCWRAKFP
ncbi:inner membrane protein [Klebsiella variicola]|uniref:Inner membrane protein n=1 Tax=Klebsiella variicola TaxID=244366 RepID=A0A7H4MDN0_KLEVA|nr:inner membrane protein [Klebsiella variicola]